MLASCTTSTDASFTEWKLPGGTEMVAGAIQYGMRTVKQMLDRLIAPMQELRPAGLGFVNIGYMDGT